MAKRGADKYITDQNWEDDEEEEEAGVFKPAKEDILQKRIFKKAKRRGGVVDPEAAEKPGTPVFKGFAGFTGFSSSSAKPSFSFGGSGSDKPSFGAPDKESTSSASGDKAKDSPATVLMTSTPTDTQPMSLTNGNATMATSPKFLKMLKKLNESVLEWIDTNVKKNPYSILSPIFVDYDKYVEDLKKKYVNTDTDGKESVKEQTTSKEEEKKEEPKKESPPSSTSGLFSFGSTTSNTSSALVGTTGSIFGGALKQSESTASPPKFSFGTTSSENKTSTTSGFSFGATSDSKDSSSASPAKFSFGAPQGDSSSSAAKFSFGTQGAKFSVAAPPTADSGDTHKAAEEDEYVPPKEESKEIVEEDAFYSKRCKLFYKTSSGEWKERGIGNLHLKPCNDNTQLVIRAETSLGNILLNIMLTSTMPINRQGKNNVMILCVPNPPIDSKSDNSDKPVSMLLRVKTGDDADELLDKMKNGKPE